MKSQSKQGKITIKQFQWYEVQTKVREIISQLLQPFNKKQNEDTVKMNELKRNITQLIKKVDDHDFLLQRQNAEKPKYIQLQDDKIEQMSKKFLQNEANNSSRLKKMQITIEVYEQKINQLNELQRRLDAEIMERLKNFQTYKQSIDSSISLMLQKIESQQDQNNLLRTTTRTSINKVENKLIGFNNRLTDLEDEIKRKSQQINRLTGDSINHNEKIIKLQLKMSDIVNRIQERQKDTKLSQKFFAKVKQVENDLDFLHKYLEAYQPLYIQLQISQTLNAFVTGKQRRVLCVYEEKRFAKMHNHILMNDSTTLEDLMSSYSNSIRKVINRNRKYVINLKVEESIKYGANLYEIRMEQNIHDDDQEVVRKPVNFTIPIEDIEKSINQKWQKLQTQINSQVTQLIKPTKQWIKQLQQQSFIRFSKIETQLLGIGKKQQEIKMSIELYEGSMSKEINKMKDVTNVNSAICESLKSYIKDILNFNSVLNHIVIQDQIDRQGTALYAMKGNSVNNAQKVSSTIQLDTNCMSCHSDQKTVNLVQQAFKMACLTYNPSQIKIDDQFFSRQEILQISTNILERLKKKIDSWDQPIIQKPKKLVRNLIPNEEENQKKQNSVTTRKSLSTIKDQTPRSRVSSIQKDKQMITLLPTLGSRKNMTQTEKNTIFSVFY